MTTAATNHPALMRPLSAAIAAVLLVAALVAAPTPAQAVDTDSEPDEFTVLGDLVLFAAGDGLHGRELWATDATDTWLVKDVWPGPDSSHPNSLTAIGDRVYFVADDGSHGTEVWVTDGTSAGTELLDDTWPGPDGIAQGLFVPVGGAGDIVFRSGDGTVGEELYVHDVSAGTTTLIEDLNPGTGDSYPSSPTPLSDGRVIFSARVDGSGSEPYITDGTTITSLGDLAPGATSALPNNFVELEPGVILFEAWNADGNEPWVTDGTPGGTMLLQDINPGAGSGLPTDYVIFNGDAWFAATDGVAGYELWTTDGTPGGTTLVHDVEPGAASSDPRDLFVHGDHLYFNAIVGGSGRELWRTDGTPGGFELAVELRTGPEDTWPEPRFSIGDTMILTAAAPTATGHTGLELFASDGTTAGTELIHELAGPDSSFPDGFEGVLLDDTIVFEATDGRGMELWASDGTPGGSALVGDLREGIGPQEVTVVGDRAFFSGQDLAHGRELWVTRSTPGTEQVIDLVPGPTDSYPRVIGVLGDRVLVNVQGKDYDTLWVSDGTPAGSTALTAPYDESGVEWLTPGQPVGDVYVVPVTTLDDGMELWVTDGTAAGTTLLKDIEPGPESSYPDDLTVHGGRVFFRATTAAHGAELWTTDGTSAGTTRLADLNPGPDSSTPEEFTVVGNWLYFAAEHATDGLELWRVDTDGDVEYVTDLNPGPDGSNLSHLTAVGDRVFFRARLDVGTELYVSDGTPGGTMLVKDIDPVYGSVPNYLTASGDRLFFTAEDPAHGKELWTSDGTEAGTSLVKDLTPGPDWSNIREIVPTSEGVLFTVDGSTGVAHAYRSDGTAAGTVPADLPGFDIQELTLGSLWYTGFDEETGRGQLYRGASADSDAAVPLLDQSGLDRLSGDDRFATAAAVSSDTFASADTVVIARGDVYADALAGGPLAFQLDAPILLTRTGSLPDVTRDEINRLGATTAIILGGEAAVSSAVAEALTDTTSITSTSRHAGADRFETAALVAADLPATTSAYVVEGANADPGRGWPDAVAVSSLASWTATPILLVTQSRLPGATADALSDLGTDDVVIVGGAAAVSGDVADAIEDEGVSVADRLAGDNRFLTSLAVAQASVDAGMDDSRLWVATGRAFPDALVAGPAAAASQAPLLLVHGTSMTAESDSADWFDGRGPFGRLVLLGGEAAITSGVANVIRSLAGFAA